jgi:RNA polymerase sigma-70 factor (family 1)
MTMVRYKEESLTKEPGNSNIFPGIDGASNKVEQLLERILRHNDYCAFETLFHAMYSPLCQFCLRFVQVREVAEELVSDVFFTIWKNRERMEMTSHRSYLFTAVRNRAFDHLRKVKRTSWCDLEKASHVAGDHPDSQEMMVERELNISIRKSIASLPKQCRVIFELSRDEGLKYKEIAAKLNISIKTVETQMGRALKHLHRSLPT